MKRTISAAALTLIFAGGASAADMSVPVRPAPVPQPVYDWTGFYVGVNAGVGVGRNESTFNTPAVASANRFDLSPIGAIGGGQVGYNYQFGSWVVGVEADIQGSGQRDGQTCLDLCTPLIPQSAQFNQSIDWFGTVRGRVGYATGPVYTYYTGGFAYGRVTTSVNEVAGLGAVNTSFSASDVMTGWTIGSGVEAALGGNWTGKIEYLYLDLGSKDFTFTAVTPRTVSTDIREHVFRAGLNYRIGGTPAPVYPTMNWSGFYIGGNGGGSLGRNEIQTTLPGALVPTPSDRTTVMPDGFIAGAQVGYNWQTSNVVLGVEADFQGSTQKNDDICVLQCLPASFLQVEQKMPWFGTVRGRLGYAAGPALFYVTGGLAYGKTETELREFVGGGVPLGTFNFSDTRTGWTIGAGIETPTNLFGFLPGNNWSMKTEYLYVDLGKATNGYTFAGSPQTFTSDATNHIFRAGLNYRFGAEPVVARY